MSIVRARRPDRFAFVLLVLLLAASADAQLQGTVYLHSGELETGAVDLDAGGRAGWNVVVDRTYRSRTLGYTVFGMGWDSRMLRHLRPLPNETVEYYDGAGEIWRFKREAGQYVTPKGLLLRLVRRESGWVLVDQQWRLSEFDDLGRLQTESDEFHNPAEPASGNRIFYVYGADGLLSRIVDPVGRATTIAYDPNTGFIREITDWRNRRVTYEHDAHGRLTSVKLPEVGTFTGTNRPTIRYGYDAPPSSYNDGIELAPNLRSITDPKEVASGGGPRVKWTYGSGADRDKLVREEWGTGETTSIAYTGAAEATVTSMLGQARKYTFTTPPEERTRVSEIRELNVPVWSGATFGQLPATVAAAVPSVTPTDRVWTFSSTPASELARLGGVSETVTTYASPAGALWGRIATAETTTSLAATSSGGMPAAAPITRTFAYQTVANGSTFLHAVTANGRAIEMPVAHRNNRQPQAANSSITAQQKFDANGLLTDVVSTGGTESDPNAKGSRQKIEYYAENDPALYRRGMPKRIITGADSGPDTLETKLFYDAPDRAREVDSRGVETTTTFDAWLRPVHVVTRGVDPLVLEEWFHYDATGRVEKQVVKHGNGVVTTSYTYDAVGRVRSVTRDGIAVPSGSMSLQIAYNLSPPTRDVVMTRSGGAQTTLKLDPLGRVMHERTATGTAASAVPIEKHYAYDLAGNRVYETDLFTATAAAFDAHGRAVAVKAIDGTVATTEYDGWHRPTAARQLDAAGALIAESTFALTPTGQMISATTRVDAGTSRTTEYAWDGAGRITTATTAGRAAKSLYDLAGRVTETEAGLGSLTGVTTPFVRSATAAFAGPFEQQTTVTERNGQSYTSVMLHDTAGNIREETIGSLTWIQQHDQLGFATSATTPGRPAVQFEVDSRGAVKAERVPGVAEVKYAYDAAGALKTFTDADAQATATINDLAGRTIKREYRDGTFERIAWEGTRVTSTTDRRGRTLTYGYNEKAQLEEIRDGSGQLLERMAYDAAGRLQSWRTHDAELLWESFDAESRPKKTVQRRFKDGSGLAGSPVILDEYTQEHRYNEHGERSLWSMPVYSGLTLGAGWTKWLRQDYDALGNLKTIAKIDDPSATTAAVLLDGEFINAGRPQRRTVFTGASSAGAPVAVTRTYTYAPTTGLMKRVEVAVGSVTIGGVDVTHDGLAKSDAILLGVAGGNRATKWRYDVRGRLVASIAGAETTAEPSVAVAGRAAQEVTTSDFRAAQERTPYLSGSTQAALTARGIDPATVEPPSKYIAEQPDAAHKVERVTQGASVYPFLYSGAEVTDDGRFLYDYDARGRLTVATEKTASVTKRRIVYFYSGQGRLVGRRAEYTMVATPSATDWRLEDRIGVLYADGLPAETTFVWDVVSDRLVTLARAGAVPTDVHAGLLKQVIHGGLSYDDPIETTGIDPLNPETTRRLFPVYDEGGAGSLQLVLNDKGEIVARNISNDPYGAEEIEIAGAAVDRIDLSAKKAASGDLETVEIMVRTTEALTPATVASGVRLAAVETNGTVVRLSAATPSLMPGDPFSVRWTIPAAEWTALVAGAPAVSIAVTGALRAAAWSQDVPILPAPQWALASRPIFSSAALPVEIRESTSSLSSFFNGISAGGSQSTTLYEVESLSLLGVAGTDRVQEDIVAAAFHAHPFTEPATMLNYVRARWYHPMTGMFLSPDPKGYIDSANLYAYAAAEPVSQRDSSGLALYAFDGTWNNAHRPNEAITNVARLSDAYGDGIVRYKKGVGTDWWSKHWGGLTGAGAKGRINAMKRDLDAIYNGRQLRGATTITPRDTNIDVIGFSRGAASAREFTNVVYREGIYDVARGARISAPPVRFLGVFDTVASFGAPGNDVNLGYDLSVPSNVQYARQAWARNEYRSAFPLTTLQNPDCADASLRDGIPRIQEQVFTGAHADIGGGYDDGDFLSRAPLEWMWGEMDSVGIKMRPLPTAAAGPNPRPHTPYRKAIYARDWARVWWDERQGRPPDRTIYHPPCR